MVIPFILHSGAEARGSLGLCPSFAPGNDLAVTDGNPLLFNVPLAEEDETVMLASVVGA